MNITVAICTWNRARLLDQTLAQLRRLEVPAGVEWELLVVNNNCTDDTDEVIDRYLAHLPVRRLHEPKQGHSHARNCAIAAASGELLLWTDDDVLVEPSWLARYVEAARAWPDAAFFGGPVEPWFEVPPPDWIQRNLHRFHDPLVILPFGGAVRPLSGNEGWYPAGANLGFRTEVLREYQFDTAFGAVGALPRRGDDSDVILRLLRAGRFGVWVATAPVKHYIPAKRLTQRYLWEWFRWAAVMEVRKSPALAADPWRLTLRYWKAVLKRHCLSPLKGPRWLSAFFTTAWLRGALDEVRGNQLGA